MPLNKEAQKKLLKSLKFSDADITKLVDGADEVDVTIEPTLTVLTEAEATTLKNNEYNNGKVKGVEIAVKEAKEKKGLDFSGKTIDGLLDAMTKKALEDAKVTPDAKVAEKEVEITNLRKTVTEYEGKLSAKDAEVNGIKLNSEILQHIPTGTTLPGPKVLALMKVDGIEFKLEDGKTVAYKDGTKMIDRF